MGRTTGAAGRRAGVGVRTGERRDTEIAAAAAAAAAAESETASDTATDAETETETTGTDAAAETGENAAPIGGDAPETRGTTRSTQDDRSRPHSTVHYTQCMIEMGRL